MVLPRLADDPVDVLMAVAEGRLIGPPRFSADAAVCVVAAAAGYPESPVTGDAIGGLGPDGQLAEPVEGVTVLHAGTTSADGVFRVDGGQRARSDRPGPVARHRPGAGVRGRGQGHLAGHAAPGRHRPLVGADGGVPVIPRYTPADAATLFSDEARLGRWLEVELLTVEALAKAGVAPQSAAAAVRAARTQGRRGIRRGGGRARAAPPTTMWRPSSTWSRSASANPRRAWIHFGLTSSDVVDTALCVALDAGGRPAHRGRRRVDRGAERPGERARGGRRSPGGPTACRPSRPPSGRSSPCGPCRWTATGSVSSRPADGSRSASCRGPSAPTRTSTPRSRPTSCRALGLEPVPATQVIARDRHAEYLYACAAAGSTVELIATEIRHLARTEVGEVEEPFGTEPEGLLGDAPQAQPDPLGAAVRPGPGAARLPGRRPGGRRAVARARHLAQLGRAGRAARRHRAHAVPAAQGDRPRLRAGRPRRPGPRQPDRPVPRPRVQPVGAAGAGGRRVHPRRGLPDRPARRPGGLGVAPPVRRGAGRRRRGDAQRRQLDAAFDLEHLLRHAGAVVVASTRWTRASS